MATNYGTYGAGTQRAQDAGSQGIDALGNNSQIASPQYQSYSTGAGAQQGQGTPAGVGYNGNAPGQGEQFSSAALNYYGGGNIPGVSNNQQQNYANFQQQAPADMSTYYDNAQRLQDNAINTQMAARGSFGSSAAVGQLASADTNLRAQQARDQAQYGLQRAQTGGQLASGADQQTNAASQNQLNWTQGLGSLAFQGQGAGMQRYEQGNQDALQGAGVLSGMEGANYDAETANDQSLMDSAMNAQNGALTNNSANVANNYNQQQNDTKDAYKFGMGIVEAGAGMA